MIQRAVVNSEVVAYRLLDVEPDLDVLGRKGARQLLTYAATMQLA